jgi:hypothetical protein
MEQGLGAGIVLYEGGDGANLRVAGRYTEAFYEER